MTDSFSIVNGQKMAELLGAAEGHVSQPFNVHNSVDVKEPTNYSHGVHSVLVCSL